VRVIARDPIIALLYAAQPFSWAPDHCLGIAIERTPSPGAIATVGQQNPVGAAIAALIPAL